MNGRKTDKNLEERLLSGRSVTILSALEEVKAKGNIDYLPLILDLLRHNQDGQVEKEIFNIMGSLKVHDAVPVLAEALQASEYQPIKKKILTACWQNGLDYKDYLPVFIDIIIEDDWETGFEAFTVIENMEKYPGQEVIDLSVAKIERALPHVTDKKKYFLKEILLLIC